MKFTLRNQETLNTSAVAKERTKVAATELIPNESSRLGVYLFAILLFSLVEILVLACFGFALSVLSVALATALALGTAASIRVAPQWERIVVLRAGCFRRVAGPGLYALIPFVEYSAIHIDCRTITSSFSAEAALTADLVPVDVDAILFWMVWDAKKACLEVDNYPKAVLRSAQTALRDAIGQQNLADLASRRRQIDRELQEIMGEKCEQWGIAVLSVEIRDITIPAELQDALSREAQAERERNARVILAEVEKDLSTMFVEAADEYDKNPTAIQLRAMNLAYEGARDGRGVLLTPSAIADGFDVNNLFKPRK